MALIAAVIVIAAAVSVHLLRGGQEPKFPDADNNGIKDTLVIGAAAEINNLNLQEQNDQINNICLKLTHDTLFFFTNDGKVTPRLAESYKYLDDNTIRVKLRKGVTFSDGTQLTADDVKFTYDMALRGPSAGVLAGLKSVEVIDPATILLHLGSYDASFMLNLTSIPCSIQSKKAWESGAKEPWLIGTGRYIFKEWVKGKRASFTKRNDYWDATQQGVADEIIFVPIIDASKRARALLKRDIDVCIDPPIRELSPIENDGGLKVFEEAGTRLFYFAFNVQKAPWDNIKLRQAIACAINREEVIDKAVFGKGVPQTTVLNRGLWGFYDGIPGFGYDVARSKKLMAESGHPGGKITAKLLIADSTPYKAIANVIRENLKAVGVNVEIEVDTDAHLKERCGKGDQELYLWRWNEDQKIDWVYGDLYRSDSPFNYHHYKSKAADVLIEKVRIEKDERRRYKYGVELQTMLVNDCPQVPLYVANLILAYNAGLKGEYFFGGGNHDWSRAYIEIKK